MTRFWLILATAGTLLACRSEEVTFFPRADAGADVARADDAGADDAGSEVNAGRACETDADCGGAPWQCANRALLDTFGVGPNINLPGGMCTRLLCTSDDDCGDGGTCFDASALGAPVQICFASCERLTDCRWEENYGCFPLSHFEEGAEGGACVSASLEVAILCDDESCEEADP